MRGHGAGAREPSGGHPHGFAEHPHEMEYVGVAGPGRRLFESITMNELSMFNAMIVI